MIASAHVLMVAWFLSILFPPRVFLLWNLFPRCSTGLYSFSWAFNLTRTTVIAGPCLNLLSWVLASISSFDSAISSDIDEAWRIWQNASGAAHASIVQQASLGAWAAGGKDREFNGLWKTLRRQQHDGRVDAAADTLSYITDLINDANAFRL